jgi:murein peptide amidase A
VREANLEHALSGPTPANVGELRRLGKNRNGYFGETINIEAMLRDCRQAALTYGWFIEEMPAAPGLDLIAFRRAAPLATNPARVYLSAGIHGDEPAGPMAVKRLLGRNGWPDNVELFICPCLNPTGFMANRRENARGTDLNRQYLQPEAHEVIAHVAWLERQPRFDLCLCLHEDWEAHGFYLYELNPDGLPSMAEQIIKSVSRTCPVDHSELIDGRIARSGIIRPDVTPLARQQWPEAFFLLMHKTRLSYTLEAPSDFPLETRVAGLITAVESALDCQAQRAGRV